MSDVGAKWSKSIGLDKDLSSIGFGLRTERYAMVLEKNVVKFIGVSYIIYNTHVTKVRVIGRVWPWSYSCRS